VLNLVLGLLPTSRRRLKPSEEEREIFKPLLSLSRPHTVLAFVLGSLPTERRQLKTQRRRGERFLSLFYLYHGLKPCRLSRWVW
jgi:hypothetical protein